MKKFKVICGLLCMCAMCCISAFTDAYASTNAIVYDIGDKSSVHVYQGSSQYFRMDGTVTVINGKKNIGNLTNTWFKSGSGSFSHTNIMYIRETDSYKTYTATSTIKLNGISNAQNILCNLFY